MNLLFLYRRDIHEDDAGASRTIILRENFLVNQHNVKVFSSFRHLSKVDKKIIELNIKELTSINIRKAIVENQIDILCVPEGEFLAHIAYEAVQGTKCRIVTELHNKPGYAIDKIFSQLCDKVIYSTSVRRKIGAILRLIITVRDYFKIKENDYVNNRAACLLSNKFVLLSKHFEKDFCDLYHVSKNNFQFIGNPASFTSPSNIENIILNKKNEVLVVARLDEGQKRVSEAIKCWAIVENELPDWTLRIVGMGADYDLYWNMIKRLKLKNVVFEGWQSPKEYYKKAKIFLMTSRFEGWGMTIVEAQQMGCIPIVMNTFKALNDIVENGNNGFIVGDREIDCMAGIIRYLANNPDKMYQIALNSSMSTHRFSIDNIGMKWLELYKQVQYEI